MTVSRPISLTLAALGGQGGGVVSNWLTSVARSQGYVVQATSVPGVAQRTGATIYYFEFFPESALRRADQRPIMALMPTPGDVDIVVASELVEAGRVMQRGLVTPARTTLIASTHRAYTIAEKASLGDGRASSERILTEARAQARKFVAFDMAAVAEESNAVVSAVILGAIAGAAGLPFELDAYRAAIRAGGIAVERNIAGFDAGVRRSQAANDPTSAPSSVAVSPAVPEGLHERVIAELPKPAQSTALHAVVRLIDYQDIRHAEHYLDLLKPFNALEVQHPAANARLTEAVARGLALWLSFEDTIRVADLKTRADRRRRVLAMTHAKPGQLVHVSEFMKPRVEEICGTLPESLGRGLLASRRAVSLLRRFTDGRQIRTSTVSGFALLRCLASLRRWRRGTLRYVEEYGRATRWLAQLASVAQHDYALAVELAECQKLVRGYGETHERGWRSFQRLSAEAERLAGQTGAAARLARLRELAIADDTGEKLLAALPRAPASVVPLSA
jgi:indolepyruvate ferredoxin oxidoreductase beta subunit